MILQHYIDKLIISNKEEVSKFIDDNQSIIHSITDHNFIINHLRLMNDSYAALYEAFAYEIKSFNLNFRISAVYGSYTYIAEQVFWNIKPPTIGRYQ